MNIARLLVTMEIVKLIQLFLTSTEINLDYTVQYCIIVSSIVTLRVLSTTTVNSRRSNYAFASILATETMIFKVTEIHNLHSSV